MTPELNNNMRNYQVAVIFSVLFALIGFSYNVWRMELSEQNNTIRTASFEMLKELSALEQLIYTAHYDKNTLEGSPRKGWVKIGLINDLALLTDTTVQQRADMLRQTWSEHWETMLTDTESVNVIVKDIDEVRDKIKMLLASLK